jgi:hypothetical protein
MTFGQLAVLACCLHGYGHFIQVTTMLIPSLTRAGNVSGVYKSIAATQNQADNTAAQTANLADVISISSAARERLAAEASAASGAGVKMDTDKGEVALNLESYFSPKPQGGMANFPFDAAITAQYRCPDSGHQPEIPGISLRQRHSGCTCQHPVR